MIVLQVEMGSDRLSLAIEQMEDDSYMATNSDLPGFLVLADSVEEVVSLAPEVAKSLIEAMQEKGVQPGLTSEELQFPIDVEVLVV